MTTKPPSPGCKRAVFLALGWLFFALGLIGAFLPVLPTTVFMILAAWAFANSSERLHAWLYHHPRFGPSLQRWDRHRVIPLHAKIAAIGGMSISLVYMFGFSGAPVYALGMATMVILIGAIYVVTRPSQVPEAVAVRNDD